MSLDAVPPVAILVAFGATVVLGIGSYAAFKLRERRRPRLSSGPVGGTMYFERYVHHPGPSDAA